MYYPHLPAIDVTWLMMKTILNDKPCVLHRWVMKEGRKGICKAFSRFSA